MKINSQKLYIFLFYSIICAYMLGPTLAYIAGIPRIDNPLTVLFIAAMGMAAIFESKRIPRDILIALLAITVMSGWSLMHLLFSPLTPTQFMDIMFFMVLPPLFYALYLILSRHRDPLQFIRKFLTIFALFIAVPPFLELILGFQFVASDETLSLDSGSLKGLFFNPNNLATTALCTAPAILIFFNLLAQSRKDMLRGWLLFILLGTVIFASASRTAIACYLLLLALNLIYRNNGLTTLIAIATAVCVLMMIPDQWIKDFLLSLNGNEFLERFSSRLYLFLYDFQSDNSISYRQEIYNYFWNNPPFLYLGYGPKNFQEYFGGHLSDSLGFANPHSFIIELYLGFGMASLLGFLAYLLRYAKVILTTAGLVSKQRVFGLACMGIFLIAGFIPSTILRLPFIWLPCFFIFIYLAANLKNKHLQTKRGYTL